MKIDLEFAELHSPLFLGGKNHQMKLTAGERSGLKLVYDREEKELLVFWEKHEAIVPTSNVSSMWPKKVDCAAAEKKVAPVVGAIKAQASSPNDHVFSGPGAGRTR